MTERELRKVAQELKENLDLLRKGLRRMKKVSGGQEKISAINLVLKTHINDAITLSQEIDQTKTQKPQKQNLELLGVG